MVTPLIEIVRLQFNAILGKRGVRSIALFAAMLMFTKGCDSAFTVMRSFGSGPPNAAEAMETGLLLFRYLFFFFIITMFGFLFVSAMGAYSVETDIRQKYIVNVLSKPVPRTLYLGGKILSAALFIFLYCVLCVGLFLLNFMSTKAMGRPFWEIFGLLFVLLFTQFAITLTFSLVFHPVAALLLGIAFSGISNVLTPFIILSPVGSPTAQVVTALYSILPSLDQINIPAMGAQLANSTLIQMGSRMSHVSHGLLATHNLLYAAALLTFYMLRFRHKSVVPS